MNAPDKNSLVYESPIGRITIVRDDSLDNSTGRFIERWRVVHVSADVFDAVKQELIDMGLLR